MKKKLFLTMTISFILFAGFATADKKSNSIADFKNHTTNTTNSIIVKGMLVNGEVLPLIELPEVTITAKRNWNRVVSASIIDGKVVPHVTLDEVVITPNI